MKFKVNYTNNSKTICTRRVVFKWEFYDTNERVIIPFSDSVDFYLLNNRILCLIPVYTNFTDINLDPLRDSIKKMVSKDHISYNYFLFKTEDSTGVKLDSSGSNIVGRINKDSFLNQALFKSIEVISANDHLLSEKKNKKKFEVVCVYALENKPDETYPDTTVVRYSLKPNCFNFLLGRDSISSSKDKWITSIEGRFNPYYDSVLKATIPKRELLFRSESITGEVPEKVKKIFSYEGFKL